MHIGEEQEEKQACDYKEGKKSSTICTYFKKALVKLLRLMSGMNHRPKCQSPKETLTCIPGLNKTFSKLSMC